MEKGKVDDQAGHIKKAVGQTALTLNHEGLSLACLPELLEGIELPEFTAHQVDHDVIAVNELPAILTGSLMAVVD